MIVKKTRIKVSSGYNTLSAHVLQGKKNEAILVSEGNECWLKDWVKEAKRECLTYGLRHIAFNPKQAMTDPKLSEFTNLLCEELGVDKAWLGIPSSFTRNARKGTGILFCLNGNMTIC